MLPRDHGAVVPSRTQVDSTVCRTGSSAHSWLRKGCRIALVTHTTSLDTQCKGYQNSEGMSHKLKLGMTANACDS